MFGNFGGSCGSGGCGFGGSWIIILLLLFCCGGFGCGCGTNNDSCCRTDRVNY